MLLVWVWTCACDVTGLPRGAQRFTAPAQYRAWWALTEACSGLHGDFNAVTWYLLPYANSFALEGSSVNGAWYGDPNRIVLGDSVKLTGSLVRHEMLHALLQSGAHPRHQFLGNCGDIVVCIDKCVSDAGGPPDTSQSARLVGATQLPAAIVIAPGIVSTAADSGWVTITVTVTNTTLSPARVRVPTSAAPTPLSFVLFHVQPDTGWSGANEVQMDYYITLSPAGTDGSTRRVVFDQVAPVSAAPTQFTVTGSFGRSVAPAQTLTVTP